MGETTIDGDHPALMWLEPQHLPFLKQFFRQNQETLHGVEEVPEIHRSEASSADDVERRAAA